MANFTNNTTQLQNLLAKVNALPEAGSGGSGGEMQKVTGSVNLTYNANHSVGSVVCEITGLPFTPKHVCFYREGAFSLSYDSYSTTFRYLEMCEGGLYDMCVTGQRKTSTQATIYGNQSEATVTIIDGGFRVIAQSTDLVSCGGNHRYVAIG